VAHTPSLSTEHTLYTSGTRTTGGSWTIHRG
jgi:hypothetical protein